MKHKALLKLIPFSGVLGMGILVGLIIAGVWDVTGSGLASEAALEALRDPQVTPVSTMSESTAEVPRELVRPDPSDAGAIQQAGLPSLREAAARVRPAVVSVEVTGWREGVVRSYRFDLPNVPEEWRDFFRFQFPDPGEGDEPGRERVEGQGSGFIFSKDGYIITNNHVVEGATEVTVILPDKRRYEAEIVGTDEITDVAVIKIDADEDLPTVPLGDSDTLEIGDWVLAVGNPLRFDYTVTAGIVSAKGRSLDIGPIEGNVRRAIQDFIQTDAVINRGNSGGPLVDLGGRVVGINTAIASATGLYAGYGFAIPINLARTVARDLIEYGTVKRSWLGVEFHIIDALEARARSLPDNPPIGAFINNVTHGGSADEAGVERGDIILEIDGKPIDNSGQLQTLISTKKPGTSVEMVIYRGGNSRRQGRRMTVDITLQERPPEAPPTRLEREEHKADKLGLEVADLTRQQVRELEFTGEGVLVTSVERFGPTYDVGIVRGIVIVEVDGEPVSDVEDYERILKELTSGDYVMIRVYNHSQQEGYRYRTDAVRVR